MIVNEEGQPCVRDERHLMDSKMLRYSCIILLALILCIGLPIAGLEVYIWQYCLFPPSGPNVEVVVSACKSPRLLSISPDGRYISYGTVSGDQRWLLDTLTNEFHADASCGDWWLDNTIRLGGYE